MLRDNVMFAGGGQYGGNQVSEFIKSAYTGFVFNTSIADLNTLDIPMESKFHVPSAEGCSKDLDVARSYADKCKGPITSILTSKFSQFKHVFFCYSAGGGTGCGMTPVIMQELKKVRPEVSQHVIIALPSDNDSVKSKFNALRCLIDLGKMLDAGIVNNVYLLDNNSADILEVNHNLLGRLLGLFSITSENSKGIVDYSEIKKALGVRGCVNIYDIVENPDGGHFFNCDKTIIKSPKGGNRFIYTQDVDSPVNVNDIYGVTGRLLDYYGGYTNGFPPCLYTFGLDLPENKINMLKRAFEEEKAEAMSNTTSKFSISMDLSFDEPSYDVGGSMLENLFK